MHVLSTRVLNVRTWFAVDFWVENQSESCEEYSENWHAQAE